MDMQETATERDGRAASTGAIGQEGIARSRAVVLSESRRYLCNCEQAGVPDAAIGDACDDKPGVAALVGDAVASWARPAGKQWARAGSVVVVGGGDDAGRERVVGWLMAIAILHNNGSMSMPVGLRRDMAILGFDLSSHEHGLLGRAEAVQALCRPPVLAIEGLDEHTQPSNAQGGLALGAIIAKRRAAGRTTILSVGDGNLDRSRVGEPTWKAIKGAGAQPGVIRIAIVQAPGQAGRP